MHDESHLMLTSQAAVGKSILVTHRQKPLDTALSRDPTHMETKNARLRESLFERRGENEFCYKQVFITASW